MAKIKIWLLNNALTDNPNDFSARVSSAGNRDIEAIIERMVRMRSEYQEVTLRAVTEMFLTEVAESIKEGYTVSTPIFRASPGISGAFFGKSAKFNKEDHKIKVNFTANGAFVKEMQNCEVEVLGVSDGYGVIGSVIDTRTGVEDHTITPNDVILILGDKIKIEGDASEVGIFLIKQDDETRIKLQRVVKSTAGEATVLLPSLDPGDYALEIVTATSGGSVPLKEARTYTFEHTLTVLP